MLNLNAGINNAESRIDSDRDVLPFPTGGVHGPQPGHRPVSPEPAKSSPLELARSIEADLDALKTGLDRLTHQIEEDESRDVLAAIPFRVFFGTGNSGPHSPAA